jgi:hypothetical protein
MIRTILLMQTENRQQFLEAIYQIMEFKRKVTLDEIGYSIAITEVRLVSPPLFCCKKQHQKNLSREKKPIFSLIINRLINSNKKGNLYRFYHLWNQYIAHKIGWHATTFAPATEWNGMEKTRSSADIRGYGAKTLPRVACGNSFSSFIRAQLNSIVKFTFTINWTAAIYGNASCFPRISRFQSAFTNKTADAACTRNRVIIICICSFPQRLCSPLVRLILNFDTWN